MLVLSRKVGQRLVIGGGIVVVVKRIAGQRVTLGIEAPEAVKIIRGELPSFEAMLGDLPVAEEIDDESRNMKAR